MSNKVACMQMYVVYFSSGKSPEEHNRSTTNNKGSGSRKVGGVPVGLRRYL